MFFAYIDDSTDRPYHIFSCILIPAANWNDAFGELRSWRANLRDNDDIPMSFELHACNFLSGRKTNGRLRALGRHRRAQIFHSQFSKLAELQPLGIRFMSVCLANDRQDWAFERLLNRLNRTMQAWDSHVHLVCDDGKEDYYTKMVRRMRVFNLIPSNQGYWADTGERAKNITLERIIEDPQFKRSERSYFIQAADLTAYGLLRREVPTPTTKRHGVHKSFDKLQPIVVGAANPRDPMGIIR